MSWVSLPEWGGDGNEKAGDAASLLCPVDKSHCPEGQLPGSGHVATQGCPRLPTKGWSKGGDVLLHHEDPDPGRQRLLLSLGG